MYLSRDNDPAPQNNLYYFEEKRRTERTNISIQTKIETLQNKTESCCSTDPFLFRCMGFPKRMQQPRLIGRHALTYLFEMRKYVAAANQRTAGNP